MLLRFVVFTTIFLTAKLAVAGGISEPPQCLLEARCRPKALAAERAFAMADYGQALQLYQEALSYVPDPRLMRNIGQAYLMLGQYLQALAYFQRTQLTVHDPELTEQLKQDLAEAQAAVDRAELAQKQALAAIERKKKATDTAQSKRPRWRLALGSVMMLGGLSGVGFGIAAAAINGTCQNPVLPVDVCSPYYDTGLPAGLLIGAGAALTVGGVIMLAVPGRRAVLRPSMQATRRWVQPVVREL